MATEKRQAVYIESKKRFTNAARNRAAGGQPSMVFCVQRRGLPVPSVVSTWLSIPPHPPDRCSEKNVNLTLVSLTFCAAASPEISTACGIFFNPTNGKWGRLPPGRISRKLSINIERKPLANASNSTSATLHRRWIYGRG